MGALEALYDAYRDRVAFYVVYIKEAHPEDGWVLDVNRTMDVRVTDPTSEDERTEVAQACALRMQMRMPVLIDAVDNAVASAYGGWPDRLYLIDAAGTIAYQGAMGPFGFKPDELGEALKRVCG